MIFFFKKQSRFQSKLLILKVLVNLVEIEGSEVLNIMSVLSFQHMVCVVNKITCSIQSNCFIQEKLIYQQNIHDNKTTGVVGKKSNFHHY